jgi:Mce-associated membrane protein
VEDQQTDTGDLTDTQNQAGGAAQARNATPVGKRGRHRTFRPRAVTTPETETAEVRPEGVDAEPDAVEETTAATEAEAEPKPERRRLFRRRVKTEVAEPGAEAESAAQDTEGEIEDADSETETKVRRPVGRRLAIGAAAAALLFVAAGAFAGAMLQPYLADRVAADTKLDIARTATNAITTLFTYTPDDMEQLPARSSKYLGGELKDAYAKQVDALAATNKQNQIHRSAQVLGAAVESLKGGDATAIVYANISYTSANTKDVPKLFLVSYRLSMQRKGSDWVIVNMPWITSKDLTKVT